MTVILPEFPESEYKEPFYVKYFGFEIEGGFDSYHRDYSEDEEGREVQNNEYWKHDGSVRCESGVAGEIASPKFRIDRMENFRIFARENMPIEANSSAGLHVHVSFNCDEAYSRCMDKEFFNSFEKSVKDYFLENDHKFDEDVTDRFWARIGNESEYCQDEFCPEYQTNTLWNRYFSSRNGRYTHLNYPYGQHKTIECRLYPSTTKATELINMVEFFINFTNSYLKKIPKRERARRINLNLDDGETMETEVLCV